MANVEAVRDNRITSYCFIQETTKVKALAEKVQLLRICNVFTLE